MDAQRILYRKIGVIFGLIMIAMLAGCPPFPPQDDGFDGPPSGVVEMDQNTDPRFFLRPHRGVIGWLKIAGNEVRLNGRRLVRDTLIKNGAHVSTGLKSAAVIEFIPSRDMSCELEIQNFQKGRIYGQVTKCSHIVTSQYGTMETRRWPTTYHVGALGANVTVFTVIQGQASVWLHDDPGKEVIVPSYHQVILSRTQISPPRNVSPDEINSITNWRLNFQRYDKDVVKDPELRNPETDRLRELLDRLLSPGKEKERVTVPELRKMKVGEVRRMLYPLELGLDLNPANADNSYRVYRQYPQAGTEVEKGTAVRVDARADSSSGTFPKVIVPEYKKPTFIVPMVTVPELKGKSLTDARKALTRLGLRISYTPPNANENYWVLVQDPPAGRKVKRGTVVNLELQVPIY